MKRMKKLFALLMTLAMVMGLGITGFAAGDTATITINNAGNGKFATVQVIEEDSTKDTGWDFVDDYADEFLNAFSYVQEGAVVDTDVNRQTIIKGMIYDQNSTATEGKEITGFDKKYAAALNSVYATIPDQNVTLDSPFTVNEAGVWVIKGLEKDYTYSPMAAYVGFSYETGKPTGLLDAKEINAKKAPTTIQKSSDDNDKIIETEREVTYTIKGTVPYVPETDDNPYYHIMDRLTGAVYNVDANSILNVNVKIGDEASYVYDKDHQVVAIDASTGTEIIQNFDLDLSELLDDNLYANQTITITYSATVKDTVIGNEVVAGDGTNDGYNKYGSDNDKLIGGEVTLTKKNNKDTVLAGAEFVLVKKIANEVSEGEEQTYTLKYATVDSNNMLTGWVDNEKDATTLTTDVNGTITVKGLDSTATYEFKETKAPEGYSINETNAVINWGTPDSELSTPVQGTSTMVDSELAALPETGGMGTTLFTIAGCVIMISAAGLFFATRKKAN